MRYCGRFAPSPTGPLHFGSLVAALASFLDARSHGSPSRQGQWLLRMEDIDPPREVPGAADTILKSLEMHGLHWDGAVMYQSERSEAYREALHQLDIRQLIYRCRCSRQDLTGTLYPGYCRVKKHDDTVPAAWRLDVATALHALGIQPAIPFEDALQGPQQQDLLNEVGDFVIHRKDGLFAYQLAVVVDDIHQGITHVIRGADLLDNTARQRLLFQLLGASPPVYGHVPLVLNDSGQKLSKQNLAPALDDTQPTRNLVAALHFLGQNPPTELKDAAPDDVIRWGISHWDRGQLAAHPPHPAPALP